MIYEGSTPKLAIMVETEKSMKFRGKDEESRKSRDQ